MLNLKKIIVIVPLILLLIIRFSFILRAPLYLDEGIYISWADLINQSKDFAYFSLQDGKTPLFFWVLAWLGPMIKNHLLAGRLISVVAGLVTAGSWMIVFARYFNIKKSILYLFLFLVAPYGFLVERMALSDSLLMAFASLSLMFLLLSKKILDEKKNKWFKFGLYIFFSGIFLGLAYVTKTTTRLFFITYLIIASFWIFEYLKNKKIKKMFLLITGLVIFSIFYKEIIGYFRVGGHVFWNSIADKEKLMIYGVPEIIKNLMDNPLFAFRYFGLLFQYLGIYLSSLMIFVLIGVVRLISIKENRKFLWLLFYWLFVTVAICLSGKVMASRYIYATYPIILAIAVFGFDFMLSNKSKKINFLAFLFIIIALGQSSLLVFNPQRALYASDDQDYFVSANLTAVGLPEVVKFFEDKDKSKILVGVSGTWGIPEGSVVILREAGLKAEITDLDKILDDENGNWKLNFGSNDDVLIKRYLYVVGNDQLVEKLLNVGVKKIYKFDRYKGESKNYLLEVPNLSGN